MTKKSDPTKPVSNDEKFKPQNVADAGNDTGRREGNMKDVARGSEGDRRRNSQNRRSDRG